MDRKSKYLILSGSGFILLILALNKKKYKSYFNKMQRSEFIKYLYPYAVEIGGKIGVPAKFIVAQICLETNFGKSELFSKYFNVGGIKAVKNQNFVIYPTYEYINGIKTKINSKFAVYPTLTAGLIGYSKILTNRYFKQYTFKTTDPGKYAELLQSGAVKYATDINYINKIKKLLIDINKIV